MKDVLYLPITKLRIEKVSFLSMTRDQNHSFEAKKGKPVYSFIYMDSGSNEYFFKRNFGRITLNKGDFFFLPKFIPYKMTCLSDNTSIKMICFDSPDDLELECKPFVKKSVEISNEFSKIQQEQMQDYLFLYSVIYRLLYILLNSERKVPKKFSSIMPAIKEIEKNYFENRKLIYYAEMCNMCESNFRKLFKEYTGKSAIEYRNEIRLAKATEMLESGEYKISEAAYLSGFNNMPFFYKIYNRYKEKKVSE